MSKQIKISFVPSSPDAYINICVQEIYVNILIYESIGMFITEPSTLRSKYLIHD